MSVKISRKKGKPAKRPVRSVKSADHNKSIPLITQANYEVLLYKYQLLMDFMDTFPDVIYFKDAEGRLILVNKAHAIGVGLKPEQIVGKTDFDIFPRERAERMREDDQYVLKTGKPIIDKIERGTRPDGVDNYVSTTKIPRFDAHGKVVGLIGITRDVTKRVQFEKIREEKVSIEKRLEMLEDMNKIKSEFVSAVSHELRTPLAIIKQLVMLIYEETAGPINNKQREILVKARHNIERLKNIIDELLDISRIEAKMFNLRYSLVNLMDIFKDSEQYFKELAAEKSITLDYKFPNHEVNIFIDPERIVQVITNLINNAIKFTEEGGQISVEVKVLETKIRVGVIDTGVGILQDEIPKIFDKFVQVSSVEGQEKKGIGLGLSIVKELVERHGGEIWIESDVGVGSKFYFTLPLFYTNNVLERSVKDKINHLLEKNGINVYLVNLQVVNYKDFRKRLRIHHAKFLKDLRRIIDETFKKFFSSEADKDQVVITETQRGRYSIIFPEQAAEQVQAYCELLRKQTKTYFLENKIENVFIALGFRVYAPLKDEPAKNKPASLNIKEIYIGSEIRNFKRINYKSNIEIFLNKKDSKVFQTMDVSQGGFCFMSKELLAIDREIRVLIDLHKIKKTIECKARVAWIKKMDRVPGEDPTSPRYKVGMEFAKLGKEEQALLREELKLYYE